MKLIWIVTTSIVLVSLLANAVDININDESDSLFETGEDSLVNSHQADDDHHHIQKRNHGSGSHHRGSGSYHRANPTTGPGPISQNSRGNYQVSGYSQMKGDCGGHDISNLRGSVQECAGKCSGLFECKGFLYIHSPPNYPYQRCWLKRKLCSNPHHPRGQVVFVYTKEGGSGGNSGQDAYNPTYLPVNRQRVNPTSGPGPLAPDRMRVSGYSEQKGDCQGSNIANVKASFQQCADQCSNQAQCKGFLYIHLPDTYVYHHCWLKSQMCSHPNQPRGILAYVYTKSSGGGGGPAAYNPPPVNGDETYGSTYGSGPAAYNPPPVRGKRDETYGSENDVPTEEKDPFSENFKIEDYDGEEEVDLEE